MLANVILSFLALVAPQQSQRNDSEISESAAMVSRVMQSTSFGRQTKKPGFLNELLLKKVEHVEAQTCIQSLENASHAVLQEKAGLSGLKVKPRQVHGQLL